jgi:hypothetical protein
MSGVQERYMMLVSGTEDGQISFLRIKMMKYPPEKIKRLRNDFRRVISWQRFSKYFRLFVDLSVAKMYNEV